MGMNLRRLTLIAGAPLALAVIAGGYVLLNPSSDRGGQTTAGGAPGAGARPGGGPPGMGSASAGRRAPPASVVAAAVEERVFVARVEALGTLEPRERVELTANASDRVTAVYFEDGQRVRRGATLMVLAADEERAQFDSAQAQLAEARRQLERNERLSQNDAVSEQELQRSIRDRDSAEAQVRALEARLRDRVLVAPFEGVLGFRRVSTGAFVSPGQPVATLIDDREMRLEFSVPSIHGATLISGLMIEGRSADLPGEVFTGAITSIDNTIDPNTRTVKVRATLPNDRHLLKAGMFMTVELFAPERRSLAAPEIAVIAEGSEAFVYVVDREAQPNIAVKTPVQLGVREKGLVEITQGLLAGDFVVTDGVLKVRPNAPIVIEGAPAAKGATEPRLAGAPSGDGQGLVR
jgi:membrane fusion protein (multidrug efflux system)